MEQNEEKPPIKRYECLSCEAIIDIPLFEDIRKTKCCKKPEHKLIFFEDEDAVRIKIAHCYEMTKKILNKYMDMPEETVTIISLWILGTYIHSSFSSYPYLFINAMRGSGKTRLLKLISHLSYGSNGNVYSGIRETLLFRTPKHHTLVLDEMESIGSKDKASLREYLNASYKKGATVSRAKKVKDKDGETFVLENFEPYKPIVMANINGLDEVLETRCITVILERSNNPSKTKLVEDFESNLEIQEIKRTFNIIKGVMDVFFSKTIDIFSWNNFIQEKYTLSNTYNTLNPPIYIIPITPITPIQIILEEKLNKIDNTGIEGRHLELLLPIINVALMINEEEFDSTLLLAKNLIKNKKEEESNESYDIALYEFVSNQNPLDFIPIKVLLYDFRIWLDIGEKEQLWINNRWLGRALKRLSLCLEKKKKSGMFVRLDTGKAKEKLKMFKKEDK